MPSLKPFLPKYTIFKDNILSHPSPLHCPQSCHSMESKVDITDILTDRKVACSNNALSQYFEIVCCD